MSDLGHNERFRAPEIETSRRLKEIPEIWINGVGGTNVKIIARTVSWIRLKEYWKRTRSLYDGLMPIGNWNSKNLWIDVDFRFVVGASKRN